MNMKERLNKLLNDDDLTNCSAIMFAAKLFTIAAFSLAIVLLIKTFVDIIVYLF